MQSSDSDAIVCEYPTQPYGTIHNPRSEMFEDLRKLIHRPKSEPNSDDIARAGLALDVLARSILDHAEEETEGSPSGTTLISTLAEEYHDVDHDALYASIERLAPDYTVEVVERSGISYKFRKK